ncbi:hypothetical protein F7D13_12420 [Methylocystis rosea]|uniref:Uncharacterized protein n=1 Tax=Methylocystis rosea TaxID=173366 RepID=A0ABX6EJK2_9HYPH|nr:hypothetical protein [Methylocystis rosea]QGM94760.1 hypothetical protein F7D13_12420 [Methylocystis rosea]
MSDPANIIYLFGAGIIMIAIWFLNGRLAIKECEGDRAKLYQVYFLYSRAMFSQSAERNAAEFGISVKDARVLVKFTAISVGEFFCLGLLWLMLSLAR